jgi:hypothetical protein
MGARPNGSTLTPRSTTTRTARRLAVQVFTWPCAGSTSSSCPPTVPGPVLDLGRAPGGAAAGRTRRTAPGCDRVEPIAPTWPLAAKQARAERTTSVRRRGRPRRCLPRRAGARSGLLLSVTALHHVADTAAPWPRPPRSPPPATGGAMEPNRVPPTSGRYHTSPRERTFAGRDCLRRAPRVGWLPGGPPVAVLFPSGLSSAYPGGRGARERMRRGTRLCRRMS